MKQLRAELTKVLGAKRFGRRPERETEEHTERDAVPDVLDEMSKHGAISVDE